MTTGTWASQLAEKILAQTWALLAKVMLPAARLVPNRSVTLNGLAVASGTSAENIQLTFPTDGYIVGVRASTEDGLVDSMAATLLRVQVDGSRDLFSSGQGNGAGYISFGTISGVNSQWGVYTITNPFWQASNWVLTIQNNSANNVVCDLTFDIVDVRNPPTPSS